jgi:hypothetical protein
MNIVVVLLSAISFFSLSGKLEALSYYLSVQTDSEVQVNATLLSGSQVVRVSAFDGEVLPFMK